jgi:hypothetical protein
MGRAFRVLKRTAHLTVQVAERPEKIVAVGTTEAPKKRARKPQTDAKKSEAKSGTKKSTKKAKE